MSIRHPLFYNKLSTSMVIDLIQFKRIKQLLYNMKYVHKGLQLVEECDLFASNISVRYKSDDDYKTLTSAILSLTMIIFFAYVGFNSFVTMLNRTDITSNTQINDDPDPTEYDMGTSNFMFAVSLAQLNMNIGPRYFNFNAQQTYVVNGQKTTIPIPLQPCNISQWTQFGDSIIASYQKLNFDQWLCPAPNTSLVLRGKYSSNLFDYVKIYVSNCTGIVNGQGCLPSSAVASYQAANDTFGFNFYFINTIINPGNLEPTAYYLDDTNNFQFSSSIGTLCNFYLQSYQIDTDMSLVPIQDIQVQTGSTAQTTAFTSVYPVNLNLTAPQFLKFYLRKSPLSISVTRSFFRFDDLLSYIGGLFGLIALIVQFPLGMYNKCCFELSLATDLFHYKQNQQKQKERQAQQKMNTQHKIHSENDNNNGWGDTMPPQNLPKKDHSRELHSIERFNFFWYILFMPYLGLKKMGWKSLHSKKLEPFYQALKEIRKQIDLGGILQRLRYMDRMSKVIFDQPQIKLLHLSTKQNIQDISETRSNYKIHKKLSEYLINQTIADIFALSMKVENTVEKTPAQEIQQCYDIMKKRKDKISKRILQILDPQIRLKIESGGQVSDQSVIIKDIESDSDRKQQRNQPPDQFNNQLQFNTHQNLYNPNMSNQLVVVKNKRQNKIFFNDDDKISQYHYKDDL